MDSWADLIKANEKIHKQIENRTKLVTERLTFHYKNQQLIIEEASSILTGVHQLNISKEYKHIPEIALDKSILDVKTNSKQEQNKSNFDKFKSKVDFKEFNCDLNEIKVDFNERNDESAQSFSVKVHEHVDERLSNVDLPTSLIGYPPGENKISTKNEYILSDVTKESSLAFQVIDHDFPPNNESETFLEFTGDFLKTLNCTIKAANSLFEACETVFYKIDNNKFVKTNEIPEHLTKETPVLEDISRPEPKQENSYLNNSPFGIFNNPPPVSETQVNFWEKIRPHTVTPVANDSIFGHSDVSTTAGTPQDSFVRQNILPNIDIKACGQTNYITGVSTCTTDVGPNSVSESTQIRNQDSLSINKSGGGSIANQDSLLNFNQGESHESMKDSGRNINMGAIQTFKQDLWLGNTSGDTSVPKQDTWWNNSPGNASMPNQNLGLNISTAVPQSSKQDSWWNNSPGITQTSKQDTWLNNSPGNTSMLNQNLGLNISTSVPQSTKQDSWWNNSPGITQTSKQDAWWNNSPGITQTSKQDTWWNNSQGNTSLSNMNLGLNINATVPQSSKQDSWWNNSPGITHTSKQDSWWNSGPGNTQTPKQDSWWNSGPGNTQVTQTSKQDSWWNNNAGITSVPKQDSYWGNTPNTYKQDHWGSMNTMKMNTAPVWANSPTSIVNASSWMTGSQATAQNPNQTSWWGNPTNPITTGGNSGWSQPGDLIPDNELPAFMRGKLPPRSANMSDSRGIFGNSSHIDNSIQNPSMSQSFFQNTSINIQGNMIFAATVKVYCIDPMTCNFKNFGSGELNISTHSNRSYITVADKGNRIIYLPITRDLIIERKDPNAVTWRSGAPDRIPLLDVCFAARFPDQSTRDSFLITMSRLMSAI